jgi:hypothetical protein
MRQTPPLLIIFTPIRTIVDKHLIFRVKLWLTPAGALVINDMLPQIIHRDAMEQITL